MSGDTENTEKPEENGSFFDRFKPENFSLDSIDSNLIWQIPLIGGGLWFLGSMLFGEKKNPNQSGTGAWANLGIMGAVGGAIWYFFMRTPSREKLFEEAAELGVNPEGYDNINNNDYTHVGKTAYQEAYQVEFYRTLHGSADAANKNLDSAIDVLRDAKVKAMPEDLVARADATVDAAVQATLIQRQQESQPSISA